MNQNNDNVTKLFAAPMTHETFLIDEGLELLASYKRIANRKMRDRLREMINEIAEHYPPLEADPD